MAFNSNSLLDTYYSKQKSDAKKLMFGLGPIGVLLLLYWFSNIFGLTIWFVMCLIVSYIFLFMFIYYGTLVLDAKYMNRLIKKCSFNKEGWHFVTLPWFLRKEMLISADKLVDVKKINTSFFKHIGDIYKITIFDNNQIKCLYISSKSFDEFEEILAMFKS